ncbi:hypothetical protein KFU94_66540 [Chloroflexi bacterium TSY]|nr:hypothetical protein [Chloroflexi bacterium TSY]
MMNFSVRTNDDAMDYAASHASEIDYAASMMFSAAHLPCGSNPSPKFLVEPHPDMADRRMQADFYRTEGSVAQRVMA